MAEWDAIVVGAGIAGCAVAEALGREGFNVLLLEAERKVKIDTGIVSKEIEFLIDLPRKLIKKEIREIDFLSPSKYEIELVTENHFAYLLRAEEFRSYLRKRAKERAELRYERVVEIILEKDRAVVCTESNEYPCRLVVGCDGAASIVREKLGIRRPNVFASALCRTRNRRRKRITVYFNKIYSPHYFAWEVPFTNEVGLICKYWIGQHLESFVEMEGYKITKVIYAPIAIGTTRSYADRCMLVGEACGQVKPLTGGGIVYSLTAARLAASAAKKFLSGRRDALMSYEKRWKKILGFSILLQSLWMELYRKLSNRELDRIFRLFEGCYEFEKIRYDNPFSLVTKLPKRKLMRTFPLVLPLVFTKSYF